ncbi:hypothetical protein [Dongia deserti]|uniref:hypothetical protein n=1 Tax=Dongia deserti TaxID=2268030 RepID=UPI000E64F214|nr:hypothetical protein [Dongia deserti]
MSSPSDAREGRPGELFSPRTLMLVIAIGIAAFAGMLYLQLFADPDDPDFQVGATTYSSSAIGHKALLETLRRIDVPVIVSRFRSGEKAGSGSLLVLAEPDDNAIAKALLGGFGNVPRGLLVLPKWEGRRDLSKPRWVRKMDPVSIESVERVLDHAQIDALIKRIQGTFTIEMPEFGGRIELTDPQVLIDTRGLRPIVSLKGGVLIGEVRLGSGRQWVLSDPDLISNHGIDEADNVIVAVSMIEKLRPSSGVVIFDETIHGFEQRPNLLKTAFELPFSIVTLSSAVAILLAIWGGMMRFGRPEPGQRALQPGKVTLIRTTADLLRHASRRSGTVELVLTRYLRAQIADMVARLNGPRGLSESRQIAWLDDLANARRLRSQLHPIAAAIDSATRAGSTEPGRAMRLAADLHAWKQEFLYGLAKGSSDR